MWQSTLLGLALSLVPAEAGKLEFTNIRSTYGQFGPARADLKARPGDIVCIAFDIVGLTADTKGKIRFVGALEVRNEKGEVKVEKPLAEIAFCNVLAGPQVPHIVEMPLAVDTPPGKYTMKVSITDSNGMAEGSFTRIIDILPPEFSLVRCQFTYDIAGGIRMPNIGTLGQVLYLNMGLVGFKRDANNDNQGAVSVEMTVYDDQGRPTLAKPLRFPERENAQMVPLGTDYWHVQFDLPLSRVAEFKVELKAFDHVAKKSATLSIPLQVTTAFEEKRK